MNTEQQIKEHLETQAEPRRSEMQALHQLLLALKPGAKLWFYDGKDSDNKTVANPAIGYGEFTLKYANGKTREWFQIGLSSTKTGISIYVMGLNDKNYLSETYGQKIGKASITSYCIKFKSLKCIDIAVLKEALQYGFEHAGE